MRHIQLLCILLLLSLASCARKPTIINTMDAGVLQKLGANNQGSAKLRLFLDDTTMLTGDLFYVDRLGLTLDSATWQDENTGQFMRRSVSDVAEVHLSRAGLNTGTGAAIAGGIGLVGGVIVGLSQPDNAPKLVIPLYAVGIGAASAGVGALVGYAIPGHEVYYFRLTDRSKQRVHVTDHR